MTTESGNRAGEKADRRVAPVVDLDEYGVPIEDDRYRRLGAGSKSERDVGLYVRFEPGFGLNVHIGMRAGRKHDYRNRPQEFVDVEKMALSIQGWDHLCSLVDEWRERIAATPDNGSQLGGSDA